MKKEQQNTTAQEKESKAIIYTAKNGKTFKYDSKISIRNDKNRESLNNDYNFTFFMSGSEMADFQELEDFNDKTNKFDVWNQIRLKCGLEALPETARTSRNGRTVNVVNMVVKKLSKARRAKNDATLKWTHKRLKQFVKSLIDIEISEPQAEILINAINDDDRFKEYLSD